MNSKNLTLTHVCKYALDFIIIYPVIIIPGVISSDDEQLSLFEINITKL